MYNSYKGTRTLLVFFMMVMGYTVSQAQINRPTNDQKVLIIGEDEGAYEDLVASCPDMLLAVAGNSMEEAFKLWTDLLEDMQQHAKDVDFDLNGVKMWINIFWNADGSINKIVYYPKPTSKNMDFELLTDYLNDFAKSYVLPTEHSKCFSHYGSASFPLFNNSAGAPKK